ncbi:penicillin acylase family protein [Thalassomonas actiniarum]|uniref:Penicillin acylase family protein n=1 Tax=Thalassomonas actiniarum TaxID=485447 RepID=A0AAF0C6D0_9GAMM|nr:penicillin acylase family protein [Thalassomonas actiniarum]WDE02116.1 penicillin acylase family protein [Thalassomonas actiniarum]
MRVFNKMPLTFRFTLFVFIPLFFLVIYSYKLFFLDPLPDKTTRQFVNGLDDKVSIERDNHGLVKIKTETDKDVYFAMGYVHAQDRLWQLELQRRISQGRLSEIFGKTSVHQDIWFRTLGLYQAASESIPSLSPKAKASLEAYAAGINSWIQSAEQLPVEFSLLDISPEPWTITDSLAWIKVFSLNLAHNLHSEIEAYIGAQYLSDEQLSLFYPELADSPMTAKIKNEEKLKALFARFDALQTEQQQTYKIGGSYVGSNAWVVSGELTQSGVPILANDPHLGLQLPSLWYSVKQEGKNLAASGMSLVGLPVVIFGKNNDIAWGGTNMMADVQDLYIEKINPDNSLQYQVDGEFIDFETRNEIIKVKAESPAFLKDPIKDVEIQVRSTIHGPVISDVIQGFEQPISLRWTALNSEDTTYNAFYQLSYASNWQEYNRALEQYVSPALNLFYADNDNNIGFTGIGKIPLRNQGKGLLPVSGADSDNHWHSYIPYAEMPRRYNPEEGYLINANNVNTTKGYPYFISADFAPPARAERIEALLKEKQTKLTLDDMQTMQGDIKDISTTKMLALLKEIAADFPGQQQALALLNQWDGEASRESIAATIYYTWLRHLKSYLFNDELTSYWNKNQLQGYLRNLKEKVAADKLADLLASNSPWCDNINTEKKESCSNIIEMSLGSAVKEMSKFAGADMDNWRWGDVQYTRYQHTPFSQMKLLDQVFERKIGNGGSANTINVASGTFDEDKGYLQDFGAGFRQIIRLSPQEPVQLLMNSTGQSGQLASDYYDDMVERFRDVEYINFAKEVPYVQSITLQPNNQEGASQ